MRGHGPTGEAGARRGLDRRGRDERVSYQSEWPGRARAGLAHDLVFVEVVEQLPYRGDAGLDLYAREDAHLAPGGGRRFSFLDNLATVKVEAGSARSMSVVEFVGPRGFGPPLHNHLEEDELFIVLEGELALFTGDEPDFHGLDGLPSNSDSAMDRNFLRNDLLPRVASRWPGYRHTVARASEHMAGAVAALQQALPDIRASGASLGGSATTPSNQAEASEGIAAMRQPLESLKLRGCGITAGGAEALRQACRATMTSAPSPCSFGGGNGITYDIFYAQRPASTKIINLRHLWVHLS